MDSYHPPTKERTVNLTTATPLEIDSRLSDLYTGRDSIQRSIGDTLTHGHYLVNDEKTGRFGTGTWKMTHEAVEFALAEMANLTVTYEANESHPRVVEPTMDASKAINLINNIAKAREALTEVVAEIATLNAEFIRRGRWTRAFLVVTNGSGHVHSSMNCSTCYPTTQFVWMVDYAAKDESEVIDAAGERACTICYPDAPVDTRNRPSRMFTPDEIVAQAAREAKAEAKIAREQTKIAKGLTTDGSPLRIETGPGKYDHEYFKTEQSASQWVVEAFANNKMYGYSLGDGKQAAIHQIVAAMADKHDTSVDEIMAEVDRKVAAKIKRDSRF